QKEKLPKDIDADRIYILADRLVYNKEKDTLTRLSESLEAAFNIGPGRIIIRNLTTEKDYYFSKQFECPECEIVYTEPEPRLFSFNIPFGACPNCNGFGRTIDIDEDLVIPEKSKSINKGAIHPFRTQGFSEHLRALLKIAPKYNIPLDEPYDLLPKNAKEIIWDGVKDYIGINGFFKMLEENNYKLHYRVILSKYRGYTTCKHCGGSRIRTSARQVFIEGKSIPDLIQMPLNHLLEFISGIKLSKYNEEVAGQVLLEINWRLKLLVDIGLHYLTLDRLTHTLSGGESQRINLASALGSSLVGTLYVLDEPSIGMHPRDTNRLLDILFKLRNLGNTIIVVEHDLDIIRKADILIDLGPGAGENGGNVVFSGITRNILENADSLTGKYLSGKLKIKINEPRKISNSKGITIYNPKKHNLQIPKVTFPLHCMTVVTGVSGSGKSTLVHDILYEGLKKIKTNSDGESSLYDKIEGFETLSFIELVDQTPIGRSSRSTPVTYTKVFELIRELFSTTQLARQLGLKPGYFSFNVPGGRCEACEGEGQVSVDMQFLPDVHLECEVCKGTRYKREARSVLYKNKSIVDVLNMTIDEAAAFFEDQKKIIRKLKILQEVGLGYLKLGQPSSMLSGGESQRIKLASHLETESTSDTLFIFDEPTTGLHIDDVSKLLKCFHKLIDLGHTIIIIEHNLYVISSADWLIDLGPEAGEDGGRIIATGTPDKIASNKNSLTGKALKEFYEELYNKNVV
ncbi:MAG: excinuclease ABC subunit UvrA, partial [FCB group bacterium]